MNQSHREALETKHAGLEQQIHDEQTRPAPDDATLRRLKQQKLVIKEQLSVDQIGQ